MSIGSVQRTARVRVVWLSSEHGIVAGQTGRPKGAGAIVVNVHFGSGADIEAHPPDVRFTPQSRHPPSTLGCPLSAKSGLMHCSNQTRQPGVELAQLSVFWPNTSATTRSQRTGADDHALSHQ